MYQERMFETWKKGLLHLAIVIALPIFPIIIYMITENNRDSYLYVLLLTVIVSLLYEFMNLPNTRCGIFLRVENIICCISLTIMLIWNLFSLLFTYERGNTSPEAISITDCILVSLFIIPIIVVIIEIGRCIKLDIESSKYPPSDNNLVKGASTV